MKIKKNSLLLKIIFYNDIVIILTSLLIAIIMIFNSIKEIDLRIEENTRYKLKILIGNFDKYLFKLENKIYMKLSEYCSKDNKQNLTQYLKEKLNNEEIVNITIIDENNELKESLSEEISKEDIEITSNFINSNEFLKTNYFFIKNSDKIYMRFILGFWQEERAYLIVTLALSENYFEKMMEDIDLSPIDKTYYYIETKRDIKINKKYPRQLFLTKEIKDEEYFFGIYNLLGYQGDYLGSFVLAISKENLHFEKIMTALHILLFILFVVLLITTLTSKVFKRILNPLLEISNTANLISKGDKVEKIEIIGSGEIRELSVAFKDMVEKLNETQECLERRNQELISNINRIEAIDEILLNANVETDTLKLIMNLLKGFTSEKGLNYSRAIYFRYSRENDYLIGEDISLNPNIKNSGFKFQTENLKELITTIRIPVNSNIVAESFTKQRIISKNDLAYKYNFGNDLLKAIGLKNFFIFPIYGAGKFSGAIIVDNYTKNIKIQKGELELLNLLALNFSSSVTDRQKMIKKMETLRVVTIEKLANKFLNLRGKVVEQLLNCLDSNKPEQRIVEELEEIKYILKRIKQDNINLKKYSEMKDDNYDIISLEQLITDIINKEKEYLEKNSIEISMFFTTDGIIYGSKKRISLALTEIMKNAYTTLLKKSNERRINIIISEKIKNRKIELKFIDNGEGVSEEKLKKIYEPFETFITENLGLGLFFVKKIIKEHDGVIKHFSEVGKGTEVRITFNTYKKEEL